MTFKTFLRVAGQLFFRFFSVAFQRFNMQKIGLWLERDNNLYAQSKKGKYSFASWAYLASKLKKQNNEKKKKKKKKREKKNKN